MDYELLELEGLSNVTEINSTSEDFERLFEDSSKYPIYSIIEFLVSLIALVADVIILYTIIKMRKMNTVSNALLGSWIIADALSIITSPIIYIIICEINNINFHETFLCVAFDTCYTLKSLEMLFAVIFIIDWLSDVCFLRLSERKTSYYKFVIGLLWLIGILYCSIVIGLCVIDLNLYGLQELVGLILYLILLLLVIVSLCVVAVYRCRGKALEHAIHPVLLVTALVLTFFPEVLFFMAFLNITELFITFAVYVAYFDAVLNLIILYFFNKEFRKNFFKLTRRSNNNAQLRFTPGDKDNKLETSINNDVPI